MSIDTENKTMDINIPANTTATVYVPFNSGLDEMLYMDGMPVVSETEDGYYVLDGVGSGSHTFTIGAVVENNIAYSVEDNVLKSVMVSAIEKSDLYVAVYDVNNVLTDVKKYNIDSTDETVISVDMTISGNEYVKLYLWEKDSMKPLCEAEVVR